MSTWIGNDADAVHIPSENHLVSYNELARMVETRAASWSSDLAGKALIADTTPRGLGQIVNMLAAHSLGFCYSYVDHRRGASFASKALNLLSPNAVANDDVLSLKNGPQHSLPDSSANVIFTSGSTGEPKGILQERGQLAWFADLRELQPLSESDRVAHCSSPGFDTYIFEVVRTLRHGATVVVLPRFNECYKSGFGDIVRNASITTMLAPATVVNGIARSQPGSFSGLSILYSGGSELYLDACHNILSASSALRLINLYGPAEGVVACAAQELSFDLLSELATAGDTVVPIGKPLGGMRFNLSNIGQLQISGPGLSSGYITQQEAGSLRVKPFPSSSTTNRFVTSDIVTHREDGAYTFMGRVEGLVKINGIRTSASALQNTAIEYGAVDAFADVDSNSVTLYVQLKLDDTITALLRRVAATGELSMMPRVVQVDSIPLNSNGKPDTAELALVGHSDSQSFAVGEPKAAAFEQKSNLDRAFVFIRQEVRKLSGHDVDQDTDLYNIGFGSLQFALLLLRLSAEFNIGLDAEDILSTPRVRDLARLVANNSELSETRQ